MKTRACDTINPSYTDRSGERNCKMSSTSKPNVVLLGSANIVMHDSQRELHDRVCSNGAETRDLIHQILINQGELRQVYEMQNAGQHVAESIMEAGQLVCPFIARNIKFMAVYTTIGATTSS
jgi:hypothetical protein